jgi:hypothetical protein
LENASEYEIITPQGFKIYNPGDVKTDWILTLKAQDGFFMNCTLSISGTENFLKFTDVKAKDHPLGAAYPSDSKLTFDSKTGLIEGLYLKDGKYLKSGNIYNECIIAGDFFKIPITATYNPLLMEYESEETYFDISMSDMKNIESLKYDYYYY